MIFLKFPDEETFFEKAVEAGLSYTNVDGEVIIRSGTENLTIDFVGEIVKPGTYEFDQETSELIEITPPVVVDGYHINISGELPELFTEYVIPEPTTPYRLPA